MQITARQSLNNDHAYEIRLTGAPVGSLTEFRFYNTMNGRSLIAVSATGVSEYDYFGQHVAIRVRFLNTANEESALHTFMFSPEASDPPKRFTYVSPEEKQAAFIAPQQPQPQVAPEAQEK
jgi:hypothetical protein